MLLPFIAPLQCSGMMLCTCTTLPAPNGKACTSAADGKGCMTVGAGSGAGAAQAVWLQPPAPVAGPQPGTHEHLPRPVCPAFSLRAYPGARACASTQSLICPLSISLSLESYFRLYKKTAGVYKSSASLLDRLRLRKTQYPIGKHPGCMAASHAACTACSRCADSHVCLPAGCSRPSSSPCRGSGRSS